MRKVIEELEARIELMETNIRNGDEMVEHHMGRAHKELKDIVDARIKIADYRNAIAVLKDAM